MLEIKNLTKFYGSKAVLNDVSFTIAKSGKICGLIGLNGAGKSTLMKIICGLAFPSTGEIYVDGEQVTAGKRHTKIGYMINQPAFFNDLSGRQNLLMLADLYPDLGKSEVSAALEKTGMTACADKLYKYYSLGMKQRLYLTYAILNNPNLLVLDEPFNGIDAVSVKLFKDIIKNLSVNGCTVIISSHNLLDIKSVCDSVLILEEGSLAYQNDSLEDVDLEKVFFQIVSATGEIK